MKRRWQRVKKILSTSFNVHRLLFMFLVLLLWLVWGFRCHLLGAIEMKVQNKDSLTTILVFILGLFFFFFLPCRKVTIMEDPDQNIHLKNLSLQQAANEEEALNLLFLGDTNRMIAEVRIAATNLTTIRVKMVINFST